MVETAIRSRRSASVLGKERPTMRTVTALPGSRSGAWSKWAIGAWKRRRSLWLSPLVRRRRRR